MNKTDSIPDKYYIFATLLIIANRMDTLLSRDLKEFGVTTKQWFVSETIKSIFEKPPTINDVAKEMGSSHQNIKQVALKLQQKGLLSLVKDKKDARVTRLRMTEKSFAFWERTQVKGDFFIENMLKDIEKKNLAIARGVLQRMVSNLTEMEQTIVEETEIE
jgi:DNA-binding MarR family transcriptional regulator